MLFEVLCRSIAAKFVKNAPRLARPNQKRRSKRWRIVGGCVENLAARQLLTSVAGIGTPVLAAAEFGDGVDDAPPAPDLPRIDGGVDAPATPVVGGRTFSVSAHGISGEDVTVSVRGTGTGPVLEIVDLAFDGETLDALVRLPSSFGGEYPAEVVVTDAQGDVVTDEFSVISTPDTAPVIGMSGPLVAFIGTDLA